MEGNIAASLLRGERIGVGGNLFRRGYCQGLFLLAKGRKDWGGGKQIDSVPKKWGIDLLRGERIGVEQNTRTWEERNKPTKNLGRTKQFYIILDEMEQS